MLRRLGALFLTSGVPVLVLGFENLDQVAGVGAS
jgi:hypothetical protein